MDHLRSRILAAILTIAAAGIATPARSQPAPRGKPPVLIEGRAPQDWIAALNDEDLAERKWALLILGRTTPDGVGAEFSLLQDAVERVTVQDNDPDVRAAATRSLARMARSLDTWFTNDAKRGRDVIATPLRLVNGSGQPVAGATVSTFRKEGDRWPSWDPDLAPESTTSDSNGEASLNLAVLSFRDGEGIYAIRPATDRPLVGVAKVARDQLGKPNTIVMHPACRVRLRVEGPGFRELEKNYHFELDRSCWWRAADVFLGDGQRAPHLLFTGSTTGRIEFFLPPGRFTIRTQGNGTFMSSESVEVGPGHRLRSLGIVELVPHDLTKGGRFPGYHHLTRKAAEGRSDAVANENTLTLRSVKWGPALSGAGVFTSDVAFAPDGRRLATAHGRDPGSAEVKLWDPRTGRLLATWPSPEEADGVYRLAFAPDGRTVAGSVGSTAPNARRWLIVAWDVEGRRGPRVLRGHASRITALAFSPDGKTLASGAAGEAVILWDAATGHETGRLDNDPGPIVSMGFSPDGRSLAVATGTRFDLWDVPARRRLARLDLAEVAFERDRLRAGRPLGCARWPRPGSPGPGLVVRSGQGTPLPPRESDPRRQGIAPPQRYPRPGRIP